MSSHGAKLVAAVSAVDWGKNVVEFCASASNVDQLAARNYRLAVWSRQFEAVEKSNPALCFIREMQAAGHLVVGCSSVGLYKAAAASSRTVLEAALYYSYFRSHPSELQTLAREGQWYITKDEILDYHNTHTVRFQDKQKKLGLVGRMQAWYKVTSAVIHGQLPGVWLTATSISKTAFSEETLALVVDNFSEGVEIVDRLFFSTVAEELWADFSTPSKSVLLHGMPGDTKKMLGLDAA